MIRKGADYTERSDIAALKANGMTFVTRYLSRFTWKVLQADEYALLKANNIDLVLNFEDGTNDSVGGYAAGQSNARWAINQAQSRGVPGPYTVIASLDSQFPANPVAYAQGLSSVLGHDHAGVYGGYDTIKAVFDAGACKYGWQTYAWSGGRWDARAQLRQVQNGTMGGRWDLDYAQVDDFGQVGSAGGVIDMEQVDKLIADTGYANRTVGNNLGDMQNLRNFMVTSVAKATTAPPDADSPIRIILAAAQKVLAAGPVTVNLTAEQVAAIAAAVVVGHDALSVADLANVSASVKLALREGSG